MSMRSDNLRSGKPVFFRTIQARFNAGKKMRVIKQGNSEDAKRIKNAIFRGKEQAKREHLQEKADYNTHLLNDEHASLRKEKENIADFTQQKAELQAENKKIDKKIKANHPDTRANQEQLKQDRQRNEDKINDLETRIATAQENAKSYKQGIKTIDQKKHKAIRKIKRSYKMEDKNFGAFDPNPKAKRAYRSGTWAGIKNVLFHNYTKKDVERAAEDPYLYGRKPGISNKLGGLSKRALKKNPMLARAYHNHEYDDQMLHPKAVEGREEEIGRLIDHLRRQGMSTPEINKEINQLLRDDDLQNPVQQHPEHHIAQNENEETPPPDPAARPENETPPPVRNDENETPPPVRNDENETPPKKSNE